MAKPEWWSDEGLKVLSEWVVRAAPNAVGAPLMRAFVLIGRHGAWKNGPRSSAELNEAATHFERAAVLHHAPAQKALLAGNADWCRSQAAAMCIAALRSKADAAPLLIGIALASTVAVAAVAVLAARAVARK